MRYAFSRCSCGLYFISGACCAACSVLNKLSSGITNRVTGRIVNCTDLMPRSAYRNSAGVCRSWYTWYSMSTAAACCMKAASTKGRDASSSSCRRSASSFSDAMPFSCRYG